MLYVVATPLGNLNDWSPRAVEVLRKVDWIACEDTRHSAKLFGKFEIRVSTTSYHEHNEERKAPILVARLLQGETGALLSDAGTPLLSDPGYRLVRRCREEGIDVIPIPGPCAVTSALSVAGLPSDRFYFAGFPPKKAGPRKEWLRSLSGRRETVIIFLSPHGLEASLREMANTFEDRQAMLAREMTKAFETHYFGTLAQVADEILTEGGRGEMTLVVAGADRGANAVAAIDSEAYVAGLVAVRGLTRNEALKQAARELGLSKRDLYRTLLDPEE